MPVVKKAMVSSFDLLQEARRSGKLYESAD
jgi:hypothetical protein